MLDASRLITDRARAIDWSGIRKVFELGATLNDPVNLSIGQPDFPVPDALKQAAINAIRADCNGYTPTRGIAPLRESIARRLHNDLGWAHVGEPNGSGLLITAGTSGALALAALVMLGAGDECIIPDPYFAAYPHMATLAGGRAVPVDTYPDFRLTAERVEPHINERTKYVLLNSPSNPAGVVASKRDCEELLDLCRRRGVLLISDEIYDEFTFSDATTDARAADGAPACPSPARLPGGEDVLVIRGFGKTYGVTGWRLGYVAGPSAIVDEMAKLQQYTYVCAPTPAQHACAIVDQIDMTPTVEAYKARRDLVVQRLREVTEVTTPGGAFYAFPKVPDGMTGTELFRKGVERNVLTIPGGVFSTRDTHLRISFATDPAKVERGIDILCELMRT